MFSGSLALPGLLPAQAKTVGPPVVQVQGDSPYAITQRAVAEIGGMGKIIGRGDVVMIKPNIGWNRTVEQAACTNPEVLRALIELVFNAGAKKVIVMDKTCHTAEDCYQRSGIEAMAKKAGADVRYCDDNRLVSHDFKGETLGQWPVYRDFLEADKFINVPILKHHASSGLTIAMKNLYGILGGNRGKLHRDMGENIADLAAGFKNHLVLVDAYRVLMRNGPVGGRISDVELRKTVIASTHIMHADVAAAILFGSEPGQVEFLQAAFAAKWAKSTWAKSPSNLFPFKNTVNAKRGKHWQRLRIGSQVLFTWLFFFLLLKSGCIAIEHLPHTGFFFYLDPLLLWVNILAGPFLHAFLLALVPLVLTLVLGRFFCGWICPFGALQQFFTWLGSRRKQNKIILSHRSLRWKYLLLIVLLSGFFVCHPVAGLV